MHMFKLYQNKSSLRKRYSRYVQGGVSDVVGNKIGWWDRTVIPYGAYDDITITIDNVTKERADLIAYTYYGTSELEWLILQYNNVVDIKEDLCYGTTIKIPSASRTMSSICSKSVAGIS